MNGKVYVQLPFDKFGVSSELFNELEMALAIGINSYFDNVLDFKFLDAPDLQNAKVFVMDRPMRLGQDKKVEQRIKRTLASKLKGLTPQMIEVRVNYAQLNPNFCPSINIPAVPAQPTSKDDKASSKKRAGGSEEFDYEKLSLNYSAEAPRYSFKQVILPQDTLDQIERALGVIEVESKVFDEWGLRAIIPTASAVLSFYGPPGTGKSMAAEAIAEKLGKPILSATYADIESKFHGEGPKMVKAIFRAAERDNAVLFLDESDSLLSKRLTNVSDGSSQAINSMRSQLLISLEHFKGVVIFATNLLVNYDKAFLSRLINIEFTMPTKKERELIWLQHLQTDKIHVPLAPGVDIPRLAELYEFCGRDIKNSVKSACVATALDKREKVTQEDFIKACELTKKENAKVLSVRDHTVSQEPLLSPKQKEAVIKVMQEKVNADKQQGNTVKVGDFD